MASLTFYGGIDEIGGNKVLLEDGATRVFLDFGMSFDRKGTFYEEFLQPRSNNGLRDLMELGVVPRINGIYRDDLLRVDGVESALRDTGCSDSSLWTSDVASYDDVARRDGLPFVRGVLISHGHLDHFQYISLLDEAMPLYCSPITRIIIETAEALGPSGFESEFTVAKKRSLSAAGTGAFFPGAYSVATNAVDRTFIDIADVGSIGDIEVTAFPVDHSVPGATAHFLTTSDGKTIVYTGDLRFHGTRSDLTEAFRQAVKASHPDALIVEGTRLDEDEPDSEADVEERCTQLVSQTEGLAMVGFAWKDITRFRTMKRVADRSDRVLVISSKLAFLLNRLGQEGMLDITSPPVDDTVKVYLKRKGGMLYSKADYVSCKHDAGYSVDWDRGNTSTICLEHFDNGIRAYGIRQNPSKYLVHLDYYEFNELIDLAPPPGSTYIRASSEPFNDEMWLDQRRLAAWLHHFDVNAPSHDPIYVHASGHASGPEIRQLIHDIEPKAVFPIHTRHTGLYESMAPKGTTVVRPEYGRRYEI
jgi:ribonuclease J